ncbi:MAG: putative DNA modification/repair radical SAM protein [Tepidisphaerales bacterium]
MDLRRKLTILADAAKYDASCASSGARRSGRAGALGHTTGAGICHSYTPDGRCVSLLKILLTNHCIYDCQYCVNRISSDTPRARFTVDEVVFLTMEFYKRNYIEGLFLSSGVIGSPDKTMEELGRVAMKLRLEHGFNGYIHLKAVPKASAEAIALAGRYADRLSANIELATEEDLRRLAPEKRTVDVEATMAEIRRQWQAARQMEAPPAVSDPSAASAASGPTNAPLPHPTPAPTAAPARFAPAGQSTQLIVGATATPDATLLATARRLYDRYRLRRVYYSAFSPIPFGDSRLPAAPPPLLREHRLYQADWLMRFYGFDLDELTTPTRPNLPLHVDPKLAWALRHPERFPVDVNRAPRELLLRVPGLGVRTVQRLLQIRRLRQVTLADLQRLRVPLAKARGFVVTADHRPRLDLRRPPSDLLVTAGTQLTLFDVAPTPDAASGSWSSDTAHGKMSP